MKVLGLCSHPIESAATRYRMSQFVDPLARRGIDLQVEPFMSSEQFRGLYRPGGNLRKAVGMLGPLVRRVAQTASVNKYDLLFVQREAMLFGPAFFEWLYSTVGSMPMVLDLDDATYIRYVSPTFGRMGSRFKFFGKTDSLISHSRTVVCGNPSIAEYVRSKGVEAIVIPTVVDQDIFKPAHSENKRPVLGWIGTHSTFQFLESIFPVLADLAKKHDFVLRVIGSGAEEVSIEGVSVDSRTWSLESEVEDFRSIDIGLYPLAAGDAVSAEWIAGKSGFKAVQYMAVGVPFVMTPMGVCAMMGEAGTTHFNAVEPRDWYNAVDKLLSDKDLRLKMGAAARRHSVARYSLNDQVNKLEDVLRNNACKKTEHG